MTHPASIFIMDVSNSSKQGIGEELSTYLHHLENEINIWTENVAATKVSHRAGDEIVVVSSGYATGYTLAFYINQVWPFKDHKPYFGLSFGDIKADVCTIHLESWIHPFMKEARYANDVLKQQKKNREQFNFGLANFLSEEQLENDHSFNNQFETLLNTILKLQQDQVNDQTSIQALVCSLSLFLNQKNKVSHYLNRSASTVSGHIKKGKYESIIEAFDNIVKVLISLPPKGTFNEDLINNQLQQNIKRIISSRLDDYFLID